MPRDFPTQPPAARVSRESDRRAVGSYEWVRIVTSIDFDESPELVDSAGKPIKRPAGKSLKGVAFRASYWGNADGSQVYLGPARIAVSCEVDYKTAKGILRTLCAYKLLTLVQRGGGVTTPEREGNGGEYRLTVPHDLDKIAKVRSKEEIDAEIEAVKEKNRNKSTGQRRPRESRGTNTPVSLGDATGDTGQPVPATEESRGNGGVSHGATSSAIPTQHQPGKEENQPSSLSARTSVPPPCDPADDRERDESTKSEDPNLTWHQRLVVEAGCPVDRAPDVSAWLQAKFPDKGPGWWRKVQSTGDLTVHIQDALDALDADEPAPDDDTALHCATCRDTGKVTIRLVHESDAEKTTDCPDCTNDGRGKCRTHPGLPSRRCGGCRSDRLARGNEQPRTSQRTKEPLRPGYTQRPDGTRILTNSHDPNIDWNARV